MKNYLLPVASLVLISSVANFAFAQTAEEIAQSNRAAGLGINNSQQYKDAQAALAASQAAAQQQTINQGAAAGAGSQMLGGALNSMASSLLMQKCLGSSPPKYMYCVMGALASKQAAADHGAAADSGSTYNASSMGQNAPSPTADNGSAGFDDPAVKAGMEALKSAGYAIKEGGVVMPDGSFKPNSAFSSAASMAAAGMDPSTAVEAAKVLEKLNPKVGVSIDPNAPRVSGVAVDGGGGGYSAPTGGDDYSSSRNPWATSPEERRKMVEGKSMNLAGEPIGVKGDDLFAMVHRAIAKSATQRALSKPI